jgi:two-component system, NtrC family, sensor kinase
MPKATKPTDHDFKGLGFSKIGYFKEVRTKIKELEDLNIELARRHNKLEAIINSMSSGLVILDRNLHIIFANKVQESMFPGIPLIGHECYRALYNKKRRCRDCPALKTLETHETYRGEILMKEGGFAGRYYEWTTSPIKNPFGQVSEIVLLMRDITRRKEYEFKLVQADRMAAVGLLAAGIAHEINNPLTSIAGFSEGLLKRLKDLKGPIDHKKLGMFKEYLDIIFKEAYRCKDIIQNLLEYSRKSTDDAEILDVDQIIQDTVSLIRQHAKDNKIRITIKNSLATGFNRIVGNESQLKHLFLNLFNNAFKTMGGGGQLSTIARNSGNLIEITICYHGQSAASSDGRPHDRLCSAHTAQEDLHMDLSICYSIMRHHGGDLHFERAPEGPRKLVLQFPSIMP